jgi:hypothetical protein
MPTLTKKKQLKKMPGALVELSMLKPETLDLRPPVLSTMEVEAHVLTYIQHVHLDPCSLSHGPTASGPHLPNFFTV